MRLKRARRAALAGALLTGLCGLLWSESAHAEQVARETLGATTVTVERDAEGMLSLVVPGAAGPLRLGQGSVRSERVPLARGEALVLRVSGERDALALLVAPRGGGVIVRFAGETRGEGVSGLARTTEITTADVDGDGARDVVLLERHDALRACALGRLASGVRRVDPGSLELVALAIDPLAPAWLERAPARPARSVAGFALAPTAPRSLGLALPRAGYTRGAAEEPSTALTDNATATAWEASARDAVVLAVPLAGLPLERVVLTAPAAPRALPRAFTLVTDDPVRIDVTLSDALLASTQPGGRVAVALAPAAPTRCLALVVTQPSSRGPAAVSELALASSLDTDPNALASLVRALDGPEGDSAGELLLLLGPRGVDALAGGFAALSDRGAHRAVRLLASQRAPRAAEALAEALARPAVADDARAALLRFGPAALAALARVAPAQSRAVDLLVALRAPLIDRVRAVASALAAEPSVWRSERGPVRVLLAQAARDGAPFEAWLEALPATPGPRVRGLSVAAESAVTDAQRGLVASRARALTETGFEHRYRLLVPLAGDAAGRAAVLEVALRDADDDLRAEAARALGTVPGSRAGLAPALEDRVPRVRAETVRTVARESAFRPAVRALLRDDRWPSVRATAAEALAGDDESEPALVAALDDVSVPVVRAVMASLVPSRGPSIGPRLIAFAEDPRRNPELRGEALTALADRCEANVSERIARIVELQSDPMLPPAEQAIAHAALAALARVDYPRARALLQRLDANAQAIAAVVRAARRGCQRSGASEGAAGSAGSAPARPPPSSESAHKSASRDQ